MEKRLLEIVEIPEVIRNCYESDKDNILTVHETSERGLEYCINRSIADYIINDVDIYVVEDSNDFIGFFGEENFDNDKWLTGFFISPEKRKHFKKDFWNVVVDHFDGSFKSGVYVKNDPASKFLRKNGCNHLETGVSLYGPCEIFVFNKESV